MRPKLPATQYTFFICGNKAQSRQGLVILDFSIFRPLHVGGVAVGAALDVVGPIAAVLGENRLPWKEPQSRDRHPCRSELLAHHFLLDR
jgi:hypothetical protein